MLATERSRPHMDTMFDSKTTKGAHSTPNTTEARTDKQEGDISRAFTSLSGFPNKPLEPRFAKIKADLIADHEDEVKDSWNRLLAALRKEVPLIAQLRSGAVPEIDFSELDNPSETFRAEHKKRGVAVIRNVVSEQYALDLKQQIREYIRANPHTKAFPSDDPQVYELYWSPAQIAARAHPNMLKVQRFLMQFWHSSDPDALVSVDHPTSYADRLRMRMPGDNKFALGPHVDCGSCERWETEGYGGRDGVYEAIWKGRWEEYDPWESSRRLYMQTRIHDGISACSMFRMFQGWLSLSETGPYEGTLLVNPLLGMTTAYFLLRPFFSPKREPELREDGTFDDAYLAPENWSLDLSPTNSWLQGAVPGRAQNLRPFWHPHLDLAHTMVHMPKVRPGDYVSWHCDTVHAVDPVHAGTTDSSVLYIPSCPLTEVNAKYLAKQRQHFLDGTPSPDFGDGDGESRHVGRAGVEQVKSSNPDEGMQVFGLKGWDSSVEGLSMGQKSMLNKANNILGFGN